MQLFIVSAIADLRFKPIPCAMANEERFPKARGSLCAVFHAGTGAGMQALIAKLLRAECVPYVMALHVPSGRAIAIECIAESATAFSFNEVELPLHDAEWLRKIAAKARRAFELEREIEKGRSSQPVRGADSPRG
jgi:hypothetical protein